MKNLVVRHKGDDRLMIVTCYNIAENVSASLLTLHSFHIQLAYTTDFSMRLRLDSVLASSAASLPMA